MLSDDWIDTDKANDAHMLIMTFVQLQMMSIVISCSRLFGNRLQYIDMVLILMLM